MVDYYRNLDEIRKECNKKSKNKIYYYCSSYIKDKSCLKYSINKKKLEQMVKDEIIKKINIEQLDRKVLNELIDMIYVIDKNNVKIEFKNIWYN